MIVKITGNKFKNSRLFLKINDISNASRIVDFFENNNNQIVICPNSILMDPMIFKIEETGDDAYTIYTSSNTCRSNTWDFGLFTSGSTGNPKLFGFNHYQLEQTLKDYKKIYSITENSVIISTLPFHYNFTYIAGYKLSNYYKAKFLYFDNINHLINNLNFLKKKYENVVLLSNPIVMNEIYKSTDIFQGNILIDSGGAPLSKSSIKWYRNNGINLREGYGLTETYSYSHFDYEATEESLGTVGTERKCINTYIDFLDKKPIIFMESTTNAFGVELDITGELKSVINNSKISTGDLGSLDKKKRLTILGRESDNIVSGLWPKDILNLIGDILLNKCAIILTPCHNKIIIKTWEKLEKSDEIRIIDLISESTNNKNLNFIFDYSRGICHSYKLDRKIMLS